MGKKGKPRLKEEKPVTKEEAKIEEAKPEEREKKILVKKWKGKDWFNILAPEGFGRILVYQTPSTDPKNIIGRTLEVGVDELTGNQSRQHMKVKLVINKIDGKSALTEFGGFECVREHLLRMVRKRNQKVESIFDVVTKDDWLLKVKSLSVLNGNTTEEIQKRIRQVSENLVREEAKKFPMNDLLKKIIKTEIQMRIKKQGSKVYPVRFSEIARIKVLRSPEFKITKPPEKKPEKAKEEIKPEKAREKPKEEVTEKTKERIKKEKKKPKKEITKPETKKKKKEKEKSKERKTKKKPKKGK
jgi:small subunit ribosomal protein S3Ae